MKTAIIGFVLCFIVLVQAETRVEQCTQAKEVSFKQSIAVGNCRKPPCKFKKKTAVPAKFRFTPNRDVTSLTTTVNAILAGLPFPFIELDGKDACGNIYKADGVTKIGCPLKANEEYVYKNKLNVLEIYPRLRLIVHWGLTAQDGQDVMCFEVKGKIVN